MTISSQTTPTMTPTMCAPQSPVRSVALARSLAQPVNAALREAAPVTYEADEASDHFVVGQELGSGASSRSFVKRSLAR